MCRRKISVLGEPVGEKDRKRKEPKEGERSKLMPGKKRDLKAKG
jgi:hypothetical protein